MKLCYLSLIVPMLLALPASGQAGTLDLSRTPLFVTTSVPPLVMLVMGRDHTLYYEAYNDASDLDGDGDLDVGYQPGDIDYYGYFDSHKCYSYDFSSRHFSPAAITADKTCNGQWSGDFLNYLTTSRIDALRKVLYGGHRESDSGSETILGCSYIPQDAHSWGKEYDPAVADYDIADYAPYSKADLINQKLFFASTSLNSDVNSPVLRVAKVDNTYHIWEWVSVERPVAGNKLKTSSGNVTLFPTDYRVHVQACVAGKLEDNCKTYSNGNAKPIGLLQTYGESGAMEFGLLTGSYEKNLSGGVVRTQIGSIATEIAEGSGVISSNNGLIGTLDKLKIIGFNTSNSTYSDNCGWITSGPIRNSQCANWGNPLGEMLYESLRYFAGTQDASSSYEYGGGSRDTRILSLPSPNWDDPFNPPGNSDHRYTCAKPINLVISGINPSYDADQIPGSAFDSSYSGTVLPDFSAQDWTESLSRYEAISGHYFIGESLDDNSDTTGAPTSKKVTSLARIRGLSPEEPTKGGSYYSAGVAYYGHETDLNSVSGDQTVQTVVVGLSSPLPQISIPVAGKTVTLVPYAKSVGGHNINSSQTGFQPTNTIVDYYVESITATEGTFRINFEDVEQGADHDMDMIVKYHYRVNGEQLTVTLTSLYAAGSIDQHAGYVISGTTADGIYLDVKDKGGSKVTYYLDTASASDAPYPGNTRTTADNHDDLPLSRSRTFSVDQNNDAGQTLKSPLWYAAKWGGFNDQNGDGIPQQSEWDADKDGVPDTYFPVTNAGELPEQLGKAFEAIDNSDKSSSAVALSSYYLGDDSLLFQTLFNSQDWRGELQALPIDNDGKTGTAVWRASTRLKAQGAASRTIFSLNSQGQPFVFRAPVSLAGSTTGFSADQLNTLLDGFSGTDEEKLAYLQALVNYLRGDQRGEGLSPYYFRERDSLLGDIVHSTPVYASPDNGDNNDRAVVVAGANDGMVHVFDASASGGNELLAYVPAPVYDHLTELSAPGYAHRYYVDGGLTVANVELSGQARTLAVGSLGQGGQGLFALDITNLASVPETASGAANIVQWEFTDQDDADLGYVPAAPAIVQLTDGRWAAVFANGYNNTESDGRLSDQGNGVLYVVDLEDGSLIRKLDTGYGMAEDPNGEARPNALAQPAVVDKDLDGNADTIYAGDLFGNLWKFDISDAEPGNWQSAIQTGLGEPAPLFTAESPDGNAQPITSKPSVGRHPNGSDLMVLFGTGKYIETGDNAASGQDTQSFYGLWDNQNGEPLSGRSALLQQQILSEQNGERQTSRYAIDWSSHQGWYLDLINTEGNNSDNQGERQVTNSSLRFTKVTFSTLLPRTDPCEQGGGGWLMQMDIYSGYSWADKTGDDSEDSANTLIDALPAETVTVLSGQQEVNLTNTSSGDILTTNGSSLPAGRQSWRKLY